MTHPISASMLYDLVQCPKRVALDIFGDSLIRDEVSPFVQLLWEQGSEYEQKVMASGAQQALALSGCEGEDPGPAVHQPILDYNEEDCRATRVLLDGVRALC